MVNKILAIALVVVLCAVMSGCVVGLPVAFVTAHDADAGDEKLPFVEIQDVKIGKGVDIALIKTAKLSSAVFQKDMETPNTSPSLSDSKVNAVATEEIKHSLGVAGDSSTTIYLKMFYYDGGYPWGYYYYSGTSKRPISYWQQRNVGKAVNLQLTLQSGNAILIEAHGLWWGDDHDETTGAKKLVREMVSEVLKKLGPPDSRRAAEAKKE